MPANQASRRDLLRLIGGGAFAVSLLNGVPVAFARPATERRFVFVILRGALDGLAAVPPFFDRDYREQRGGLAFAEPGATDGALDLDGRFGLHPALAPLQAMFTARDLAVFHAVATPYRSRSHFDGQDLLENGMLSPHGTPDGWLNRAIGLFGPSDTRLGLSVGQTVPLVLRGATPVGSWAPQQMQPVETDFLVRLAALYQRDPVLGPAIREGMRAQSINEEVLGADMKGNAALAGPRAIAAASQAVGKLLAASDGPRVAVLELGGWDTHSGQGLANGRLAAALRALSDGLVALKEGLGTAWQQTVMLTATEFGRTVAPNGTGGTDHGTASVALLAGGAVNGGRVVAQWPGLAIDRQFERRDLAPTMDLRAVIKGVLTDHLRLPAAAVDRTVFPDSREVRAERELLKA